MDRPRKIGMGLLASLLFATVSAGATMFVGIPDEEFAAHYRPQHHTNWCWASCIEMVLSYEGIELPQASIVARTMGGDVNLGGLPDDLLHSTNGLFEAMSGESVLVSGQFVPGAPATTVLYNHLQRRKPVILLYNSGDDSGHAVVLTGIETEIDPERGVRVKRLHVFDPALGSAGAEGGRMATTGDPTEISRLYRPRQTEDGVIIPPGRIDGVIFVEGTILPLESTSVKVASGGRGDAVAEAAVPAGRLAGEDPSFVPVGSAPVRDSRER
ncbi:MAG: papain-like cysteine protease family protein [Candidatus Krumholzibacteriia bacterium]